MLQISEIDFFIGFRRFLLFLFYLIGTHFTVIDLSFVFRSQSSDNCMNSEVYFPFFGEGHA